MAAIVIEFQILDPIEIREAFGLLCYRLDIDEKKAASKCFKGGEAKIDHNIIIRLAELYSLKINIDFKIWSMSVELESTVEDDRVTDRILSELESEKKREQTNEMLKEMALEAKNKKVEKVDIDLDDVDFGDIE